MPAGVTPTAYELDLTIDPSQPTYMGRVRIDVRVDAPTRAIVLHARGPRVLTASVDDGERQWVTARTRPPAHGKGDDEELVLVAKRAVRRGAARIDIQFEAPFSEGLSGIYRVSEGGRAYAFSQMEPTDARRAFPCFDEPGFKTPFAVSITVPSEDVAVFNTPETSHRENTTSQLQTSVFAATRPLPTYLIALAVGPLEVTEGAREPTPVRAITAVGKQKLAGLALSTASAQVQELSRYFGEPYPYPKLDLVAVPEFGAGAMENAGLITFREEILLVDPQHASAHARRRLAGVMAHELSHQWFGDLVTMKWWNDVWLNEGLATWMEAKVVDALSPELGIAREDVVEKSEVMSLDSLASARKIRQPVKSSSDALEAFDGITYDKAAAVLKMVEGWVGNDVVQRGMRRYVAAHRDGNASAADLFSALDEASGQNVAQVMQSFVDQTGVPLVRIETRCEQGARVELEQSEYRRPESAKRWTLPVCVRPDGGAAVCTVMSDRRATLSLPRCPRFLVPNAEALGYYRPRLSAALQGALLKHLARLSERERIALSGDSWALVESGQSEVKDYLAVVAALAPAAGRLEWQELSRTLTELDGLLESPERRARLGAAVRKWAAPALRRVTLHASDKDTDETRTLRALLLGVLVDLAHDPAAEQTVAALTTRWLADPSSVEPSLAAAAIPLAARRGDDKLYAALLAHMKSAGTPEQRLMALSGLTGFSEPRLLERTLGMTLDGTLKRQDLRYVFRPLFERRGAREVAYGWLRAHFDELKKRLPGFILGRLVWVVAGLCDEQQVLDGEAFFRPRLARLEGADKHLSQAVERGRVCAAFRAERRQSARDALDSSLP